MAVLRAAELVMFNQRYDMEKGRGREGVGGGRGGERMRRGRGGRGRGGDGRTRRSTGLISLKGGAEDKSNFKAT